MTRKSDLLRNHANPTILGCHRLDRETLELRPRYVDLNARGDHGADPVDGMYRMVPSGDIVDLDERNRRLEGAKI